MIVYLYFQLFLKNIGHIQPFTLEIVQALLATISELDKWTRRPIRMTAGIIAAEVTTTASVVTTMMFSGLKWMVIGNDETCAMSLAAIATAYVIKWIMTLKGTNE